MHFIIALVLLFTLVSFVGLIRFDKPKLQVGEITRFTSGVPGSVMAAKFRPGLRLPARLTSCQK